MGRTEKSIKNIAFGMGAQIVTTIISFVTKSLFVKILGDEVNSLNGLFHEIVMNLSLAELGIGSAIVYNLYKPLAEGNTEKVSELMTFFKKVYRIIAAVLLVLGTLVCIFVPRLVSDLSFSDTYMRGIFMLFVINISSSYLFSYKISLLNADQKNYLYSFYWSILSVAQAAVYVIILVITKNYIAYLITNIITTVVNNYILSRQVDKRYPYLEKRDLPKEDRKNIFNNVKNIFIKELSGKITNSTDNILISVMVSTLLVGKNTFYAAVLAVLKQVTERINQGLIGSMGNLFAVGSNEDCKRVLFRLTWAYGVIGIFFSVCFYCCVDPFISAWVGVKYLLDKSIVFILAVNLMCFVIAEPIYTAMHVSGFFKEGRNISIIGSTINLIVSVVLGHYTGILGIFVGTFFTYFIQILMKIYYVYKLKFKESSKKYLLMVAGYYALLLVLMLGCSFICSFISTSAFLVDFFAHGIISATITFGAIYLLYGKTEYFKFFADLLGRYIRKRR